jgi:hypothetical protein
VDKHEEERVTSPRASGPRPQATGRPLRGITLQGAALFLFIPLVLFLFLGQPIGPGWSVAVGVAIMLGHRVVAAPWMAKFADVRCLWCGRVGVSVPIPVTAQGRTWAMNACGEAHAARLSRFLTFVYRYRAAIGAGIFLPLAWLLVASLAAAFGRPLLTHDTNASIFRVVVAATVVSAATVPFAVAGGTPAPPGAVAGGTPAPRALHCPFPLHNLFLLGIGNTLWVFRLVGAWWLADGAWRLFRG